MIGQNILHPCESLCLYLSIDITDIDIVHNLTTQWAKM